MRTQLAPIKCLYDFEKVVFQYVDFKELVYS